MAHAGSAAVAEESLKGEVSSAEPVPIGDSPAAVQTCGEHCEHTDNRSSYIGAIGSQTSLPRSLGHRSPILSSLPPSSSPPLAEGESAISVSTAGSASVAYLSKASERLREKFDRKPVASAPRNGRGFNI